MKKINKEKNEIEIQGIKFKTGKTLTAPNTPIVRAYIDALKAAK